MGWKLGYVTSLDGTRVKDDAGLPGSVGTIATASVPEEIGDEPAKVAEYDGGWASKKVGKVDISALDSR
jgi:hypothetical protein